MYRLLYVSRATALPSADQLSELVRVARLRNQAANISGLLCGAGPYFLQVLEGPVVPVNRLLGRLFRDPRHTDLTLLSSGPCATRLFPNWGMRLVSVADLPDDDCGRLLATDPPDAIDPHHLLAFLCRLSDHSAAPLPRAARGGAPNGLGAPPRVTRS